MADKLRKTFPLSISFLQGEQPTSGKLNSLSVAARNSTEVIEKVTGDPWNQSGDAALSNDYPLQLPNLARMIGEHKYLNPVIYPIQSDFEFRDNLGQRYRGQTEGYLTYRPKTGSSFTVTAGTTNGQFTTPVSDPEDVVVEPAVPGNYYIDPDTGWFKIATPLLADETLQYDVEPTADWMQGQETFPGVIPDPRQDGFDYCRIEDVGGGKFHLHLPPRRPLTFTATPGDGFDSDRSRPPRYPIDDEIGNTGDESNEATAGGSPKLYWQSDTVSAIADAHYRYSIPEELLGVTAGDRYPSGFMYLWDSVTNTIVEDVIFTKPLSDPGDWIIQIESINFGPTLTARATADETEASYNAGLVHLIICGSPLSRVVWQLQSSFLRHDHSGGNGLHEPVIDHGSLVGVNPPEDGGVLGDHDTAYPNHLPVMPHSKYDNDHHTYLLSRTGSQSSAAQQRDPFNNAMLGHLLLANADTTGSHNYIDSTLPDNSFRVYFGDLTGPSIYGTNGIVNVQPALSVASFDFRTWSASDTDIDSIINGSNFGNIIEGRLTGQFTLGIRENDNSDGIHIISGGGNYNTDSTYDTLVAAFKANGYVGIGTTSPLFGLHIVGTGANGTALLARSSKGLVLNPNYTDGDSFAQITTQSGSSMDLVLSTQEDLDQLYLDVTGNVGIATSNPLDLFDVAGNTDVTAAIGRARIGFRTGGTTDTAAFAHYDHMNPTDYGFLQTSDGRSFMNTPTGGSLNFRINNVNVGFWDSTGLGIGTLTPANNIHIQQTGKASIYLEADTDDVTETHTAYLKMSQDGGTVDGILGFTVSSGTDPENNAYTNTGTNQLLLNSSSSLMLGTNGTGIFRIDNAGLSRFYGDVGIGVTPSTELHVQAASNPQIRLNEDATTTSYLELENTAAGQSKVSHIANAGTSLLELQALANDGTSAAHVRINRSTNTSGASGLQIHRGDGSSNVQHIFADEGNTSWVCNYGGNFLVGHNSTTTTASVNATAQIYGSIGSLSINRYAATNTPAYLILNKSRNTTFGSHTAMNNNDELGRVVFAGSDGSLFQDGAYIRARTTEPWDPDNLGTKIEFATADNGPASAVTTRMTIDHDGQVGINTTSPDTTLHVNGDVTFGDVIPQSSSNTLGHSSNPWDTLFLENRTSNPSVLVTGTTWTIDGYHYGYDGTDVLRSVMQVYAGGSGNAFNGTDETQTIHTIAASTLRTESVVRIKGSARLVTKNTATDLTVELYIGDTGGDVLIGSISNGAETLQDDDKFTFDAQVSFDSLAGPIVSSYFVGHYKNAVNSNIVTDLDTFDTTQANLTTTDALNIKVRMFASSGSFTTAFLNVFTVDIT